MKIPKPLVAWLEDDDIYRQEVHKQTSREPAPSANPFLEGRHWLLALPP